MAIVRKYFTVPDGPGTLDAYLNTRGPQATWEISYNIATENGSSGWGLGTVDAATGRILRFNLAAPNLLPPHTGPLGPAKPEAEAREKAWALVTQMFPAESGSLRPAPSVFGNDYPYYGGYQPYNLYTFTWFQYQNDVPFLSSMVRVQLDRQTLDYVALESNLMPDVKFAKPLVTLTPAEAMDRFRAGYLPVLSYQPKPSSDPYALPSTDMTLVYNMLSPGMLDAASGKFVDSNGVEVAAYTPAEALPPGSDIPVLPGPLPVTEQRALAFAAELLQPPVGGQLQILPRGAMYGGDSNLISVDWYGSNGGASMTLDPKTGLIRSAYRKFAPPPSSSASAGGATPAPPIGGVAPGSTDLSPDQMNEAKKTAIALVQRFYSPIADHLKLESRGIPQYYAYPPQTNFTFQRYENGIPVSNNAIQISIDPESMAWVNISANWTADLTLPDPGGAIAPAEALEKFLAARQPVMLYQLKYDPKQPPRYGPDSANSPGEAMLIYQLASPDKGQFYFAALDALTGAEIDPRGDQPSAEALDKLLTGNRAEGELRYLLANGALTPDKLDPEAPLTRGQALQMLLRGQQHFGYSSAPGQTVPYTDVQSGNELYYQVMSAYQRGVLRPEGDKPTFGADEPITRAEFATWIVQELNLGALARSGLKTESSYGDLAGLTVEQRNGIAFLEALGILPAGDAFRGDEPLSQADGAAWVIQLILNARTAK